MKRSPASQTGQNGNRKASSSTICETARREVLGRLLKLNHERYAEEVQQGLHDKKRPRNTRKKTDESGGMFG